MGFPVPLVFYKTDRTIIESIANSAIYKAFRPEAVTVSIIFFEVTASFCDDWLVLAGEFVRMMGHVDFVRRVRHVLFLSFSVRAGGTLQTVSAG